jgi:hypothetical protein
MSACAIIDNDVDKILAFLNTTGQSAVNFARNAIGVAGSNISRAEEFLRESAAIISQVNIKVTDLNKLRNEALEYGCSTGYVDTALRVANAIITQTNTATGQARTAINDAKKLQAESEEASRKENNAGTGSPGTAGQGPNASQTRPTEPPPVTQSNTDDGLTDVTVTGKRNPDELEDVQVTGKRNPDELAEVEVTGRRNTNTNQGLEGELSDARAQANKQDSANYAREGDWRVRLSLAPEANYLYRVPKGEAGILEPLQATDGVIFPYTPSITINYAANYGTTRITHANYPVYQYENSTIDSININCDFTAQDTFEANYLLAVIHFFRSVTKMFYGKDQNPTAGTPPPLCYLFGLGAFQFNAHPLVITTFNYSLPTDVDYIRATTSTTTGGVNRSASNTPDNSNNISLTRLQSGQGNLTRNGEPKAAQFSTAPAGSTEPTYVPTRIQIQLSAYPLVSRNVVSAAFSLKDYATGKLMRGIDNVRRGGLW